MKCSLLEQGCLCSLSEMTASSGCIYDGIAREADGQTSFVKAGSGNLLLDGDLTAHQLNALCINLQVSNYLCSKWTQSLGEVASRMSIPPWPMTFVHKKGKNDYKFIWQARTPLISHPLALGKWMLSPTSSPPNSFALWMYFDAWRDTTKGLKVLSCALRVDG